MPAGYHSIQVPKNSGVAERLARLTTELAADQPVPCTVHQWQAVDWAVKEALKKYEAPSREE
jgi:hypothetical protein